MICQRRNIMEQDKQNLLEMIDRPAFVVCDGIITETNQTARNRQIHIGKPVWDYLANHAEDYQNFRSGILHLTLEIGYVRCGAMVMRQEMGDVFLMDRDSDQVHLQTLALAAQQLRAPLSNIMNVSDILFPELTDPAQQEQAAQLRRSYFQMMRLICNMADADRYYAMDTVGFEKTELSSFFREIVDQARCAEKDIGICLAYHCPQKHIFSLIDRDQIKRAVFNLISNAVKFSPAGSTVTVTLSCTARMANLTVEDHGEGIPNHVYSSLFQRYLREPAIEDTRFGLGLGMTLVRSAAAAHNGTVLLEQNNGTRITMSMLIRKEHAPILRSPKLTISDYTGGYDANLLEFAESLPPDAYKTDI